MKVTAERAYSRREEDGVVHFCGLMYHQDDKDEEGYMREEMYTRSGVRFSIGSQSWFMTRAQALDVAHAILEAARDG